NWAPPVCAPRASAWSIRRCGFAGRWRSRSKSAIAIQRCRLPCGWSRRIAPKSALRVRTRPSRRVKPACFTAVKRFWAADLSRESWTTEPMRFAITTLGCKVNQYDSAVIESRFGEAGLERCGFDEVADVYVV